MKFKVGDKVIINEHFDRNKGDYGITIWKRYLGEIYTIRSVRDNEFGGEEWQEVTLYGDSCCFTWPSWMLKIYEDKSMISYYLRRRVNEKGR